MDRSRAKEIKTLVEQVMSAIDNFPEGEQESWNLDDLDNTITDVYGLCEDIARIASEVTDG